MGNGEAAGGDSEGRLNKTQAVLEYLQNNPGAGNTQIANELTKQTGVEFKPTGVSTIKHQLKQRGLIKGKRGRKPGRKPGRPAGAVSNKIDVADLVAAKKLAERLGGVEKARKMLDVLAQIK